MVLEGLDGDHAHARLQIVTRLLESMHHRSEQCTPGIRMRSRNCDILQPSEHQNSREPLLPFHEVAVVADLEGLDHINKRPLCGLNEKF